MKDLQEVLSRTMELYRRYGDEPPVIEEFVAGYRWLASIDSQGRFSQALRVGKEKPEKELEGALRSLIGQEVQKALERLFAWGDPEFRVVAVSLLNLLGKAFNSPRRLQDRGISRTEGQQFRYDVRDKKVGIIGYGLYNNFFLGKCAQFHAFDLRDAKGLLSYRIGPQETKTYPEGIHWHLGANALEFAPVLEKLDIVIMTGCTIVNHSYRGLLEACKNAQIRGIYGPSCELCPDYLFDLGYNYVFSASVRDKEEYLKEVFAPVPVGNDLSYMDVYELTRKAQS